MSAARKYRTPLDDIPLPPCARLLGWRLLDSDAARGWVRIGFEGRPEFLNPAGFIQGGILAAMLDDTMGPAVFLKSSGACHPTTIDLHVSYLSPAAPGSLVGEANVLRLGKTVAFVEGRLIDSRENEIARAAASVRLVATAHALG
jgi:uncharacterized protein (TIGR00369 family)